MATLNGKWVLGNIVFNHSGDAVYNLTINGTINLYDSVGTYYGTIDGITIGQYNSKIYFIISGTPNVIYENGGWTDIPPYIIEFVNASYVLSKSIVSLLDIATPLNQVALITYQNTGDNRKVNKESQLDAVSLEIGNFKDDVDIRNFDLYYGSTQVPNFNYVYIPCLKRYYFVQNYVMKTNDAIMLTLKCDVLYSFKDDILACQGYVERTADSNYYDVNLIDENVAQKITYTMSESEITPITTSFGADKIVNALKYCVVFTCVKGNL